MNVLKIKFDENYRIPADGIQDSSFLVDGSTNVDYIDAYIPGSLINSVSVSFQRADGFIISNLLMTPVIGEDNLWRFNFTNDQRILDVVGALQISLKLYSITNISWEVPNTIVANGEVVLAGPGTVYIDGFRIDLDSDGHVYINFILQTDSKNYHAISKIYGTSNVAAYVRKSVPAPDEITDAEARCIATEIIVQEYTSIVNDHVLNTNNPHHTTKEQVGLGNVDNTSDLNKPLSNAEIEELRKITTGETIVGHAKVADSYSVNGVIDRNKMNKVWTDLPIASNIGDSDYLPINSGGFPYKIPYSRIKQNGGGGTGDNHYLGDFLSLEALQAAHPVARPGDFAYVAVKIGDTQIEFDKFVWDDANQEWKQATTGGQYVLTTTFAEFQAALLDGSFVVHTAKNYDETEGTIKNKFDTKVDTEYLEGAISGNVVFEKSNSIKNQNPFSQSTPFLTAWKGFDIHFDVPNTPSNQISIVLDTPKPTYNLTTMLAETPQKLAYSSCETVDNYIYIFGGLHGGTTYLNTIYRYDIINNTIELMNAILPTARAYTSCVTYKKDIFIFGGYNGSSAINQILKYDTVNDTITVMDARFPSFSRASTGSVLYKDFIYIFGGHLGSSSSTNQILKYDPINDTISIMNSVLPESIGNFGCSRVNNLAYIIGGNGIGVGGTSQSKNTIYEYNIDDDTVNTLTIILPTVLSSMGYQNTGKWIYLFGGRAGTSTNTNQILRLDVAAKNIITLEQTLSNAAGRISCAKLNDDIFLINDYSSNLAFKTSIIKFSTILEGE